MGAGKSSVGKILAEKLNRDFYDTDKLIEESTKKSIPAIFESEGEDYFRDREEEVIKQIATETEDAVVALGGGALLKLTNWKLINYSGLSVYLKWEPAVLLNRLIRDDSRPLVANIPQQTYEEQLLKMFEERRPLYAKADLVIDCSEENNESDVAAEIINRLETQK